MIFRTFSLQTSSHSRLNIAGFSSVTSIWTWRLIKWQRWQRWTRWFWSFSSSSLPEALLLQVACWASSLKAQSRTWKVQKRIIWWKGGFFILFVFLFLLIKLIFVNFTFVLWEFCQRFELNWAGCWLLVAGQSCHWSEACGGFPRCLVFKNMLARPLVQLIWSLLSFFLILFIIKWKGISCQVIRFKVQIKSSTVKWNFQLNFN